MIGIWISWLTVSGQGVIYLKTDQLVYTPSTEVSFWIDPTANATFRQALQADRAGLFQRSKQQSLNFGSSEAAIWLRLRVRADNPAAWLLESSNHLLEDIQFIGLSGRSRGVRKQQQGLFFSDRPKDLPNNLLYFRVFPPSARPGDTVTVYLRAKNMMPLVMPLRLVTVERVAEESHPKDVLAGLLYGVLVAMALYNFCLLLVVRDRVYLYYVIYVLSSLLTTDFQGYLNEFVMAKLFPAFPRYVSYVFVVLFTSVLLFAQQFLNTPRYAPRLDKGIRILLALCWVPVVLRLLDMPLAMTLSMQVLITLIAVYLLGMGVYLLRQGVKEARFYVLAWTTLLVATLVFLGRVNGFLPDTLLLVNAIPIGLALETVLLSFALADRITVYRRETAQAQLNLIASIRETEQTRNRVLKLEMSALRNQMNPHFLFNSLNSIQRFILAKDPLTAADYLTRFARLMRFNLDQSRESTVTLQREIEMLTTYLELELLRFGNPFTYQFVVGPELNTGNTSIPGMVVQPFVENAIWHGLMHKTDGGGVIQIIFCRVSESRLRCTISDNGVGRQVSSSYQSPHRIRHRSAGMTIISERLALLTNDPTIDSHVHVTDLTDETGHATGTRVDIDLPVL
jgi:sensor histidine kinase YesM